MHFSVLFLIIRIRNPNLYPDTDPGGKLNAFSMRIRIRIYSTVTLQYINIILLNVFNYIEQYMYMAQALIAL